MSCDEWLNKNSQKPKSNKAVSYNESYTQKNASYLDQTLIEQYFTKVRGLRTLRSGYISQEQLEVADEKQLPSQCLVVDSKCDGIQSDNELISETHRGTPHEAVVHETHKSEGCDECMMTDDSSESSEETSFSDELRKFSMELNEIEDRFLIDSETQT